MKILLLGGTGAMGSHLKEILSSDNDNIIYITSRKKNKSNGNIVYVKGNAHDNIFLAKLLEHKWDVIVDFMVYNTEEFSTRINHLLKSCNQYVYLSSARVYADSVNPIVESNERLLDTSTDKDFLQTDEYAITKARQENILTASSLKNWTIIRPYITYSDNRLQLGVMELQSWLYRALLGHSIVFSKDISEKMTTMTYGYDVARGIVSIIGNNESLGETYHITTRKSIKWSDVLNIYLEVIEEETGKRPKVVMTNTHPYYSIIKPIYQVKYDRCYNRVFDSNKIGKLIDLDSFVSPEIGLHNAIREFIRKNKELKFTLNPLHEAKYDRISGEYYSLNRFKGITQKGKYIAGRYFPKLIYLIKSITTK